MNTTPSNMLSYQIENQKQPDPIPEGRYLFLITGWKHTELSDYKDKKGIQRKAMWIRHELAIERPHVTLNPEVLKKVGGADGVRGKKARIEFFLYLEEEGWTLSNYRERFLTATLGLKDVKGELCKNFDRANGKRFWGNLVHDITEDGRIYLKVNTDYATLDPA